MERTMTTNPLDAIQARANKATDGPWEAHLGAGWYVQDGSCDEIAIIMDRPGIDEDPQAEANANFIINAREDVPRLVAALRAVAAIKPWNGDYPPYDNGYNTALQDVHAAIREALGG